MAQHDESDVIVTDGNDDGNDGFNNDVEVDMKLEVDGDGNILGLIDNATANIAIDPANTDRVLTEAEVEALEATMVDPSDHDYDPFFPQQRIGGLLVPAKYEVWLDGVYSRRFDQKDKYPQGQKPPRANLEKPAPKIHRVAFLERVTERPIYLTDRGVRPDVEGDAVELAAIRWLYEPKMDNKKNAPDVYKTIWLELAQICDARKILELGQYRIPINSDNAAKVMRFLNAMYEANFRPTITKKVAWRTGYYDTGSHGWLVGSKFIGSSDVVVDSANQNEMQRALYARGLTGDPWLEFTRPIVKDYPIARWFLACSFTAPILRIINYRTFVVHHFGTTKVGKTAMAWLAQSAWGDPKRLSWSFNASTMAMTEVFRLVSDVPILFNELQASDIKHGLGTTIYNWCEGRHRERVRKEGGLVRSAGSWITLIRTSGEETLIKGGMEGQVTRVIEVPDSGIPEELSQRIYRYLSTGAFGHAGPAFLAQLGGLLNSQTHPDFQKRLVERFDTIRQYLRDHDPENEVFIDRMSAIAVGDFLMLRWIYGYDPAKAYEIAIKDAMDMQKIVSGRMDQKEVLWKRVLARLHEHRRASPQQYCDLTNESGVIRAREGTRSSLSIVAYETADEIWYNPAIVAHVLKDLFSQEADPDRMWGDLSREGIIKSSKNRLQRQREHSRAGIVRGSWFYVVDKTKFEVEDESEESHLVLDTSGYDWSAFEKWNASINQVDDGSGPKDI